MLRIYVTENSAKALPKQINTDIERIFKSRYKKHQIQFTKRVQEIIQLTNGARYSEKTKDLVYTKTGHHYPIEYLSASCKTILLLYCFPNEIFDIWAVSPYDYRVLFGLSRGQAHSQGYVCSLPALEQEIPMRVCLQHLSLNEQKTVHSLTELEAVNLYWNETELGFC